MPIVCVSANAHVCAIQVFRFQRTIYVRHFSFHHVSSKDQTHVGLVANASLRFTPATI